MFALVFAMSYIKVEDIILDVNPILNMYVIFFLWLQVLISGLSLFNVIWLYTHVQNKDTKIASLIAMLAS